MLLLTRVKTCGLLCLTRHPSRDSAAAARCAVGSLERTLRFRSHLVSRTFETAKMKKWVCVDTKLYIFMRYRSMPREGTILVSARAL